MVLSRMLSELLRPSLAPPSFLVDQTFPAPLPIPEALLESTLMEIGVLRYEAWIAEGVPPEEFSNPFWIDQKDRFKNYYHFVVRGEDKRIEASARLSIHDTEEEIPGYKDYSTVVRESKKNIILDPPIGSYNRLVVRPDLWNQGIGSRLLEHAIQLGLQLGCNSFVTGITPHLLKRCLDRGFEYIGEEESFKGIPTHYIYASKNSLL